MKKLIVYILTSINLIILSMGDFYWYDDMIRNDRFSEWDYQLLVSGICCILFNIIVLIAFFISKFTRKESYSKSFLIILTVNVLTLITNSILCEIVKEIH